MVERLLVLRGTRSDGLLLVLRGLTFRNFYGIIDIKTIVKRILHGIFNNNRDFDVLSSR